LGPCESSESTCGPKKAIESAMVVIATGISITAWPLGPKIGERGAVMPPAAVKSPEKNPGKGPVGDPMPAGYMGGDMGLLLLLLQFMLLLLLMKLLLLLLLQLPMFWLELPLLLLPGLLWLLGLLLALLPLPYPGPLFMRLLLLLPPKPRPLGWLKLLPWLVAPGR